MNQRSATDDGKDAIAEKPTAAESKPRIETEADKAKKLAEQVEGKPKDEITDRTGRYR